MAQDFYEQLKQLGKVAKKRQSEQVKDSRAVSPEPIEEKDVVFSDVMAGVVPLKPHQRYERPRQAEWIRVRSQNHQDDDGDRLYVGDGAGEDPPKWFSKNGRGQDDIRRLQSRHWPMVGYVDLHGYRQDEVQEILNDFVAYVQDYGVCGEIVHGQGWSSQDRQPVLKNVVRRWLIEHPEVIAYTQPNERNDGAVYILLKRKKSSGKYQK